MTGEVTFDVEEDVVTRLPWWKWKAYIAPAVLVEPTWLLHLCILMMIMWNHHRLQDKKKEDWLDKNGRVQLKGLRRWWYVRYFPYVETRLYDTVRREVTVQFDYYWEEADWDVGSPPQPQWDIISFYYTDTCEEYTGCYRPYTLDDDIAQWITDNSEE